MFSSSSFSVICVFIILIVALFSTTTTTNLISAQLSWPTSTEFQPDHSFVRNKEFTQEVVISQSPSKGGNSRPNTNIDLVDTNVVHFQNVIFQQNVYNNESLVFEQIGEKIIFENCEFRGAVAFFADNRQNSQLTDPSKRGNPIILAAPSTGIEFINCSFTRELFSPIDSTNGDDFLRTLDVGVSVSGGHTIIDPLIAGSQTTTTATTTSNQLPSLTRPFIRVINCTFHHKRKYFSPVAVELRLTGAGLSDTSINKLNTDGKAETRELKAEPAVLHEITFTNNTFLISEGLPNETFCRVSVDVLAWKPTNSVAEAELFRTKRTQIGTLNISHNNFVFTDDNDDDALEFRSRFMYITEPPSTTQIHRKLHFIETKLQKTTRNPGSPDVDIEVEPMLFGPAINYYDISHNVFDFGQVTVTFRFIAISLGSFSDCTLATVNKNRFLKIATRSSNFLEAEAMKPNNGVMCTMIASDNSDPTNAQFVTEIGFVENRNVERYEICENVMTIAGNQVRMIYIHTGLMIAVREMVIERNSLLTFVYTLVSGIKINRHRAGAAHCVWAGTRYFSISGNEIDARPNPDNDDVGSGGFESKSYDGDRYASDTSLAEPYTAPTTAAAFTETVTKSVLELKSASEAEFIAVKVRVLGLRLAVVTNNTQHNMLAGFRIFSLTVQFSAQILEVMEEEHKPNPPAYFSFMAKLIKNDATIALPPQAELLRNYPSTISIINNTIRNLIRPPASRFISLSFVERYVTTFTKPEFFGIYPWDGDGDDSALALMNVAEYRVENNSIINMYGGPCPSFFAILFYWEGVVPRVLDSSYQTSPLLSKMKIICRGNVIDATKVGSDARLTQPGTDLSASGIGFISLVSSNRTYVPHVEISENNVTIKADTVYSVGGVAGIEIQGVNEPYPWNVLPRRLQRFGDVLVRKNLLRIMRVSINTSSSDTDFSRGGASGIRFGCAVRTVAPTDTPTVILNSQFVKFDSILVQENSIVINGTNRDELYGVMFQPIGELQLVHNATIERNTLSTFLPLVHQGTTNMQLSFVGVACVLGERSFMFPVSGTPLPISVQCPTARINPDATTSLSSLTPQGSNTAIHILYNTLNEGTTSQIFAVRAFIEESSALNRHLLVNISNILFASSTKPTPEAYSTSSAPLSNANANFFATHFVLVSERSTISRILLYNISSSSSNTKIQSLCLSKEISRNALNHGPAHPGLLFHSTSDSRVDHLSIENVDVEFECLFENPSQIAASYLSPVLQNSLPLSIPLVSIAVTNNEQDIMSRRISFLGNNNIRFSFQNSISQPSVSPPDFSFVHISFSAAVSSINRITSPPSSSPFNLSISSLNNIITSFDSSNSVDSIVTTTTSLSGSTNTPFPLSRSATKIQLGCFKWNSKQKIVASDKIVTRSDLQSTKFPVIEVDPCAEPSFTLSRTLKQTSSRSHSPSDSANTSTMSDSIHIEKEPEPKWKVDEAARTTMLIVAPFLQGGGAAQANNMRKLNGMASKRSCQNASDIELEPLPFDYNPLTLSIGGSSSVALASYRGAVIGALLFCFICFIIAVVVVLVYAKYKERKLLARRQSSMMMMATEVETTTMTAMKSPRTRPTLHEMMRGVPTSLASSIDINGAGGGRLRGNIDSSLLSSSSTSTSTSWWYRWTGLTSESVNISMNTLRFPSVVGNVIVVIGYPAICAAVVVFTYDNAFGRRSDFDIIMCMPSVLFFAGACTYLTVVNYKKLMQFAELSPVPPIEGSSDAREAQEEADQKFFEREKRKQQQHRRRGRSTPRERSQKYSSQPPKIETTERETSLIPRIWQYLTYQKVEWTSTSNKLNGDDGDHEGNDENDKNTEEEEESTTEYVEKYGSLIEIYNPAWFLVMDCICAVIIAVTEGLSYNCISNECCVAVASIDAAVILALLGVCFKYRPILNRLEGWLTYFLYIFMSISSVLIVVEIAMRETSNNTNTAAEEEEESSLITQVTDMFLEASFVSTMAMVVVSFIGCVVVPIGHVLKNKCGSSIDGKRQFDDDNDYDENQEMGRNNDDNDNDSLSPTRKKMFTHSPTRNQSDRILLSEMLLSPLERNSNNRPLSLSSLPSSPSRKASSFSNGSTHRQQQRRRYHHDYDEMDEYFNKRTTSSRNRSRDRSRGENDEYYRSRNRKSGNGNRQHHTSLSSSSAQQHQTINDILKRNTERFQNL